MQYRRYLFTSMELRSFFMCSRIRDFSSVTAIKTSPSYIPFPLDSSPTGNTVLTPIYKKNEWILYFFLLHYPFSNTLRVSKFCVCYISTISLFIIAFISHVSYFAVRSFIADETRECGVKTACLLPIHILYLYIVHGPIAQWSEPPAHNRLVQGSNPCGPTTYLCISLYRKSLRKVEQHTLIWVRAISSAG